MNLHRVNWCIVCSLLACLPVVVAACDTATGLPPATPDVEGTVQARLTEEAAKKTQIAIAVEQTLTAQSTLPRAPETPTGVSPTATRLPPTPTRLPFTPTPTRLSPTPARLPPTPTRFPPTPTPIVPTPQLTYHVVQPGETLYRIALRYGVTTHAIMQANGLANPRLIYAGQRLVIPGGSPPPTPTRAAPTPTPVTPTPQPIIHVVQPGETLYRIAIRYGVTVWAIFQANNLTNPQGIYVGQKLVIPRATPAPAP